MQKRKDKFPQAPTRQFGRIQIPGFSRHFYLCNVQIFRCGLYSSLILVFVVYSISVRTGGMQDRRDPGEEGCRKGGIQERRDAGKEACRTGRMQDRRDAGHESTGEMQDRRLSGDEGGRTGGIQDWRDSELDGYMKGGVQERRGAEHWGDWLIGVAPTVHPICSLVLPTYAPVHRMSYPRLGMSATPEMI